MADEPWLYSPALGLRFGPFTLSDRDRKAADDRWQEIQRVYAEQQKSKKPEERPIDEDRATREWRPSPMAGSDVNPPLLKFENPWDLLRRDFGGPPTTGGRLPPDKNYPGEVPPPDGAPPTGPRQPDAPAIDPATADPAAPQDEMSSLQEYLKMIEKFYPERSNENPYQAQADAYLAKEAERTRLLAQLALAAGLTAQGGPGFEGMSKGFAAAANVYGQGFARYQSALQDSADRYAKQRDEDYSTSIAKHDAAVRLYTSSREDARKRAESRSDKEQERIGKLFQNEFDLIKGGEDGLGADPAKFAEWQRRYQLWLKTGEYIPPLEDVSDG